jgi:serine/threonine protein kinase
MPQFMAPEIHFGSEPSFKADVCAFGILMVHVLIATGLKPFCTTEALVALTPKGIKCERLSIADSSGICKLWEQG